MSISHPLLESLNSAQRQAVQAELGNMRVIAGAGSGKTRVLTYRVLWLMETYQAPEESIMAVTFTNKAAHEMRERLSQLLQRPCRAMWVGTFHGLAHRLLRAHWLESGLPEHFQIMDGDDQLQLLRRISKQLNIDEDRFELKRVQGYINRKKDEGHRPLPAGHGTDMYERVLNQIYAQYESICRAQGLVDFAELMLRSYEMLQNCPLILAHYQQRFRHFLVDEFQDTNSIQYAWLKALAGQSHSIFIVGDDDQSIYRWRGADPEHLYRFVREFSETKTVILEKNYRSKGTILDAANCLIQHNEGRLGKNLWTDGEAGERITLYEAFNEEDEALFIVRQIRSWLEKGCPAPEIAILYRSNAQSRLLEEAFIRAGIPYLIYGGLRFFERAEIKDALAYLRLAMNEDDDPAFERAMNMPPRGIGDRTLAKIRDIAQAQGVSLFRATTLALSNGAISGRLMYALSGFMQLLRRLKETCDLPLPLSEKVASVVHETGLLQHFRDQKGEKAQNKADNLEELINATQDFEQERIDDLGNSLTAFLAHVSLDAGELGKQSVQAVQLMTLHAAKGLEFTCVGIVGLEESLFPHHFSRDSNQALEEERRLCYVGITRAKQKLYLTFARKRRQFGRDENRFPSRFIGEIPGHLLERLSCEVKVSQAWSGELDGDFRLGQRVLHPKFGEGIVLDQEGQGELARIHIHFDGYGSKWLALQYARLEAVNV